MRSGLRRLSSSGRGYAVHSEMMIGLPHHGHQRVAAIDHRQGFLATFEDASHHDHQELETDPEYDRRHDSVADPIDARRFEDQCEYQSGHKRATTAKT